MSSSLVAVKERRNHGKTLFDYAVGRRKYDFMVEVGGVRFGVKYGGSARKDYSLVSRRFKFVESLDSGFLLGSYYDGRSGKAYLKFYSDREGIVYVWYDQLGHLPYFITDLRPEKVREIKKIVEDPSFVRVESVRKYDLLRGKEVRLSKIVVKDPQAVPRLRKLVPEAWEAKIKYHDNYVYDNGLVPGL
ncbi:MAG: hypothetical protein F7B59_00175, partial [Desulfurococcales archaeon]|nr:hypothetical protein [Desulfurococcales archaeon]